MAKYSKTAQHKIEKVMHEYKHGELKSGKEGKGGKVKNRIPFSLKPNTRVRLSVTSSNSY